MKPQNGNSAPPVSSHSGASRRHFLSVGASTLAAGAAGIMIGACGSSSAGDGGFRTSLLTDVNRELAADELAHVKYLRTAIAQFGGQPIAKPALNLAALGQVSNETQYLTVARAFEDLGVSAYGGAARLISNKDVLEAAARILATEAYHAGNLRLQVIERGIAVNPLDGSDQPPMRSNFFPADTNGLAVIRTVAQVLADAGPFFPSGINGTTNPSNDIEILNFALNLEYLEAEFYSFVRAGSGLSAADTSGTGAQGATTGAPTLRLS